MNGPNDRDDLAIRVAALEAAVEKWSSEVRTRRMVVIDADGAERIVGEVVEGTAEVNVDLPGPPPGRRCGVLVFANPGPADGSLPAGVGMQLWVDGDCVDEVVGWMNLPR